MIAAAEEMGKEPPESAIPPDLTPEEEQYIFHFWELTTDRPLTMEGPGPIPWSVKHQYACVLGLHRYEDLYNDFMVLISALDAEYLIVSAEETDRKRKAAEAQAAVRKR